MIDQASVYADRYKGNRQALQAAVLGQNSEVDPYTALRALQLLKESDSMQMAQQAQQPTEAPSLLQEAMQRPQMPMGMPIPGQQMAQAPQQSGGLEAMPVPEQDFAGGGIIAFAGGGNGNIEMLRQKAQEAKRLYEAATKSGDTRAADLYLRQQRDTEAALAQAMQVAGDQTDAESTRLSYHQAPLENNREMLMGRRLGPAQRLRQRDLRQLNPSVSSGASAAQAAQPDMYQTQGLEMPGYDNPTPGKGETFDYLKRELDARNLQRGRAVDRFLTENIDIKAAQDAADAAAAQAETANLGGRYPAPAPASVPSMMSPGGVGLRGLEAAAGIPEGSATRSIVPPVAEQTPPAINQAPTDKQGAPARGLGAAAATSPLGKELTDRLKALDEFAFTDSKISAPRTAAEKVKSAKGETLNVLKDLYGDDEASAKAQAILDKRLAELDDPDSKKFDKALAWFKGAAAIQKGRGLEAVANAAGEVAGTYSTIKKEDRKARQLIEDSQMALDRAAQARKEGMIGKAFELEEKADRDRIEAEKLQADIVLKKETSKAGMLGTAAQIAGQKYNTDVTAITARERNELTAEANRLNKQGLLDGRRLTAFNAASATLERAEKNISDIKSSEAYTTHQKTIATFGSSKDEATIAKVKAAEKAIRDMDADANRRLRTAQNNFNAVASEVFKNSGIAMPSASNTQDYTSKPIDRATFDKLPKGTRFMDPNGEIRIKK